MQQKTQFFVSDNSLTRLLFIIMISSRKKLLKISRNKIIKS